MSKPSDESENHEPGKCVLCGCTEESCQHCIDKTGAACFWANPQRTLCSARVFLSLKSLLVDPQL